MENEKSIQETLEEIKNLLIGNKTVLTFDEVVEYTGLSRSHLYKKTSTGGIPCYRPTGGHIYFSMTEINKWLLQNPKKTNEAIEKAAATAVTLKNK